MGPKGKRRGIPVPPKPLKQGVTYQYFSTEQVITNNYPHQWLSDEDKLEDMSCDQECRLHLYRCEDGVPVEHINSDSGEPEDQTFCRDWAWVAKALQDAYELGRKNRG